MPTRQKSFARVSCKSVPQSNESVAQECLVQECSLCLAFVSSACLHSGLWVPFFKFPSRADHGKNGVVVFQMNEQHDLEGQDKRVTQPLQLENNRNKAKVLYMQNMFLVRSDYGRMRTLEFGFCAQTLFTWPKKSASACRQDAKTVFIGVSILKAVLAIRSGDIVIAGSSL